MKKFQVITDSTSDLELSFREKFDIDYYKMTFNIDDTEYEADLDWGKISPDEYYKLMRNGKRSTTSLIKQEEFETKTKKYLDQGLDVLYIACSSKLSGSKDFAEKLLKEFVNEYENRKVVCFDSLRSNYAEGLIAIDAAKLANEGKTIDEALEILKKDLLKYQVQAIVGSLEWLKKAGRVKASKAFFGTLLQVKPVICSDAHGNNYAYESVIGRKKSIARLIDIIVERFENPKDNILFIEHADSLEDAKYIANEIENRCHPLEINISNVGPIIGATVGPDTITISFKGKEVTIFNPE
ncbi:DegV family protein [bacterium]|nr:DegV family protein [bacterium]